MTAEQFCYYLQGYFEVQEPTYLSEVEIEKIQTKLNTVFNKVTKPKSIEPKLTIPEQIQDLFDDDTLC